MPYVKRDIRLEEAKDLIRRFDFTSEGDLNFLVSSLAASYNLQHEHRYATMNAVIGALDGAKAEYRRRVVDPYEDVKRADSDNEDPFWECELRSRGA